MLKCVHLKAAVARGINHCSHNMPYRGLSENSSIGRQGRTEPARTLQRSAYKAARLHFPPDPQNNSEFEEEGKQ